MLSWIRSDMNLGGQELNIDLRGKTTSEYTWNTYMNFKLEPTELFPELIKDIVSQIGGDLLLDDVVDNFVFLLCPLRVFQSYTSLLHTFLSYPTAWVSISYFHPLLIPSSAKFSCVFKDHGVMSARLTGWGRQKMWEWWLHPVGDTVQSARQSQVVSAAGVARRLLNNGAIQDIVVRRMWHNALITRRWWTQ